MSILLDVVENISIPDDKEGIYGNEINRLHHLGEGLRFLNKQIAQIEEKLKPLPGCTSMFMGSISGVPAGLVESSFHWYATTVCNYCRLVGHIAHELGATNDNTGLNYTKRLCKQAYTYRNKVTAHFARYKPHRSDTQSDIQYSVMNFPHLIDGRFRTGGWQLTTIGSGKTSSTSHDTNWSLTELHLELEVRFGKNFSPQRGEAHVQR
jgi:hypothetical protein